MLATSSYTIVIPDWRPKSLNELFGMHYMKRWRTKWMDRDLVHAYVSAHRIPPATGKRRVSLDIELVRPDRVMDPDNVWKHLLDHLVGCCALVDDDPEHVELGTVRQAWGSRRQTTIILEDLA